MQRYAILYLGDEEIKAIEQAREEIAASKKLKPL